MLKMIIVNTTDIIEKLKRFSIDSENKYENKYENEYATIKTSIHLVNIIFTYFFTGKLASLWINATLIDTSIISANIFTTNANIGSERSLNNA